MLSAVARGLFSLVAVVALTLGASPVRAHGEEVPPDKDSKPKVKVTTSKGRAKGMVDMITNRIDGENSGSAWRGTGNSKKKIPADDRRTIVLRCWAQTKDLSCFDLDGPSGVSMLSGPVARAMAVNLVTSLRFPAPKPIFGPDPNNNEWKMLAVGFPIWLTAGDTRSVTTTRSVSGLTFTLTARWRSTTFDMGDGRSVTCTKMAAYSEAVKAGTPSPTCGHTYTTPSLPKGTYTVRTHSNWDVDWSVAGFSGTVPAYNTGDASIAIGELSALNR